MLGKILSLFASVILLVGCSSNAPDIRAICLRDDIGNYVIKWETDPVMEGIVKMTVSDNPDLFTNESPIIYANIKDGVATYITNDNISRKYFRLSFNDKYPRIIGARSAVMDSVQNFRDLGGYTSTNGKTVKWGKVFRSGELSSLSEWDSIRLDNLRDQDHHRPPYEPRNPHRPYQIYESKYPANPHLGRQDRRCPPPCYRGTNAERRRRGIYGRRVPAIRDR